MERNAHQLAPARFARGFHHELVVAGRRARPSDDFAALTFIACSPGARVAPLMPSTGICSSRPLLRHHWRMSFSHLVPSLFFFFFMSYQTARLVAKFWSAFSTHMAT